MKAGLDGNAEAQPVSTQNRQRRATGPSLLAAARAANRGDPQLQRARQVLAHYEDAAEGFARDGRADDAVAAVQLGATMASYRHPGALASPRLERVLADLGAALPPLPPRGAPTGRILHVATETYAVGGHTRMIWRWIARDPGHIHSLLLTHQRVEVPAGLIEAVQRLGRRRGRADRRGAGARPRADAARGGRRRGLRDRARAPDGLAARRWRFAEAENRPPVAVFNHADHVFWLGAAIADVAALHPPRRRRAGGRPRHRARALRAHHGAGGRRGRQRQRAGRRARARPARGARPARLAGGHRAAAVGRQPGQVPRRRRADAARARRPRAARRVRRRACSWPARWRTTRGAPPAPATAAVWSPPGRCPPWRRCSPPPTSTWRAGRSAGRARPPRPPPTACRCSPTPPPSWRPGCSARMRATASRWRSALATTGAS